MSLTKLGCLVTALRLSNKRVLAPSQLRLTTCETTAALTRHKSEKFSSRNDDEDDENKPVKFLNSAAAKWDPVRSRTGADQDDWPWCQTYVIIVSVSVFMIYFCVLREENDIDLLLSSDLNSHFLERHQKAMADSQSLPQKYRKQEN